MGIFSRNKGETTYSVTFNLAPILSETDMNPDSAYRSGTVSIPNGPSNDNGNRIPDGIVLREALAKKHGTEAHRITILGSYKI